MIDGWIQDLLELFLVFARSFFLEGEMFSAVILIIHRLADHRSYLSGYSI